MPAIILYANMQYAITNKTTFLANSRILKADFILFRDFENYRARAKEFMANYRKLGAKLFLHNDFELALKLGANGIHFSSANISKLSQAPKELIKIASTHSEYELRAAFEKGADFVTFSPIFASPNKGEPKGLKALKYAVNIAKNYEKGVIALGGIISTEQIKAVLETGVQGFASIRYFCD